MSVKYETVLDYFLRGLWSAERVQMAVGRWITQEEAESILESDKI